MQLGWAYQNNFCVSKTQTENERVHYFRIYLGNALILASEKGSLTSLEAKPFLTSS